MQQDMQVVLDELDREYEEFLRNRRGLRQVRVRQVNGKIELTVVGMGAVVFIDETAVATAFNSASGRSLWRREIGTVVRQSGHGTIELIVEPDGPEAKVHWSTTFTRLYRSTVTRTQTFPRRMP